MTLEELQRGARTRFLFHYTDAASADMIMEHGIFVSGPHARHGVGIYATDIAPEDESTLDDVITECFDGSRLRAQVDHAVAVHRSSAECEFKQTSDPYQWLLTTGKLVPLVVPEIYVATAMWDGRRWRIIDNGN
jgi:hypothetical protein